MMNKQVCVQLNQNIIISLKEQNTRHDYHEIHKGTEREKKEPQFREREKVRHKSSEQFSNGQNNTSYK